MEPWSKSKVRALGKLGPRRCFVVPLDQVHPWIRMAHRRMYERGFELPLRIVRSHGFFLTLTGEAFVRTESHTQTVGPRQLYFVEPFKPHILGSKPGSPHEHISIHFDWMPGFPTIPKRQNEDRPPYEVRLPHGLTIATHTRLPAGHPILGWFEELLEAYHSGRPTGALEASVLMQRTLLALLRRPAPQVGRTLGQAKVQRAIDYIKTHFHESLSVSNLAQLAGLSTTHLARMMVQSTGMAPADFLRHVRVQHARTLLADLDLSIKEVAIRAGFKSPYHFSRVFRQVDGLSPTHFREALIAGQAGCAKQA